MPGRIAQASAILPGMALEGIFPDKNETEKI
jgi:hypothetical protein